MKTKAKAGKTPKCLIKGVCRPKRILYDGAPEKLDQIADFRGQQQEITREFIRMKLKPRNICKRKKPLGNSNNVRRRG